MCRFTVLFLLLFTTTQLMAQTIVTDRPDQTESSSTVGIGRLQVESGLSLGFDEDVKTTVQRLLAPTTLFRYGILRGLEIRIVNQFESVKIGDKHFQGIGDLEVGAKLELYKKEGSITEVAVLSHLILPSGSRILTNDNYGTVNKLAVSHQLSEKYSLGYNIGYSNYGVGNGDFTYSMALGIGVTEKVGIYIEPYGEVLDMEEFKANFDAGFTYLIHDNLQIDFSFGTGINHKMNYIAAGISWRTSLLD